MDFEDDKKIIEDDIETDDEDGDEGEKKDSLSLGATLVVAAVLPFLATSARAMKNEIVEYEDTGNVVSHITTLKEQELHDAILRNDFEKYFVHGDFICESKDTVPLNKGALNEIVETINHKSFRTYRYENDTYQNYLLFFKKIEHSKTDHDNALLNALIADILRMMVY